MTTARKSNAVAPTRPAPTEREQREIAAATVRQHARRQTVEVGHVDGEEGPMIGSPHADARGWSARLLDTLATDSPDFLSAALGALSYSGRDRGDKQRIAKGPINAALAMVAAVAPENEAEAGLAIQMAGVHSLACELLGRAKQTDRTDHITLYGNLAVKLVRTYTAQMEALAKIRGGGKQQVEVRHVYVNGNAVIGDVHGGGGGPHRNSNQPLARGPADASGSEMRSAFEAERKPLPCAESDRQD